MQKHTPEVQQKLHRIVVVMKWLVLGGYLELGQMRYMLDEDGSLICQWSSCRPDEDYWVSVESMSPTYFFKKLAELPDEKILEINADLALNSLAKKRS